MIYVITHKTFKSDFLDKDSYKVLHVGPNEDSDISYCRDDNGDNISAKNKYYCELTGLYWIWKNGEESLDECTGLVHYRRFFTTFWENIIYAYFGKMPQILKISKINNALEKVDVILPFKKYTFRNVRYTYAYFHCDEDMQIVSDIIKKLYPDYYATFKKVMNGHSYYYANMMICKKSVLDSYSRWLFPLIEEIEKSIDITKYIDDYQRRVFGFISERLLQVWVVHNHLKVKEYAVFNTEVRGDTFISTNIARIKRLFLQYTS